MSSTRSSSQSPAKAFIRWAFVALWMIVIFLGSSLPGQDLPDAPKLVSIIVHFSEFFVLTVLLIWAINRRLSHPIDPVSTVSAFIVASFYGILDELHQVYVPNRVPDMLDLFTDSMGAFFAVVVISLIAAAGKSHMRRKSG